MTRILVVEDSDNLRRGLCDMLDAEGYRTIAAASAEQGLAVARDMRPDLVVLDLMLPDAEGAEVLKVLRAAGSDAPVLVLTARSDEDEKVRLLRMGADDYVTKPFGRRELTARVGALLRRTSPRSGEEDDISASATSRSTSGPAWYRVRVALSSCHPRSSTCSRHSRSGAGPW